MARRPAPEAADQVGATVAPRRAAMAGQVTIRRVAKEAAGPVALA